MQVGKERANQVQKDRANQVQKDRAMHVRKDRAMQMRKDRAKQVEIERSSEKRQGNASGQCKARQVEDVLKTEATLSHSELSARVPAATFTNCAGRGKTQLSPRRTNMFLQKQPLLLLSVLFVLQKTAASLSSSSCC